MTSAACLCSARPSRRTLEANRDTASGPRFDLDYTAIPFTRNPDATCTPATLAGLKEFPEEKLNPLVILNMLNSTSSTTNLFFAPPSRLAAGAAPPPSNPDQEVPGEDDDPDEPPVAPVPAYVSADGVLSRGARPAPASSLGSAFTTLVEEPAQADDDAQSFVSIDEAGGEESPEADPEEPQAPKASSMAASVSGAVSSALSAATTTAGVLREVGSAVIGGVAQSYRDRMAEADRNYARNMAEHGPPSAPAYNPQPGILPSVSLPQFSLPSIQLPSVQFPSVNLPSVLSRPEPMEDDADSLDGLPELEDNPQPSALSSAPMPPPLARLSDTATSIARPIGRAARGFYGAARSAAQFARDVANAEPALRAGGERSSLPEPVEPFPMAEDTPSPAAVPPSPPVAPQPEPVAGPSSRPAPWPMPSQRKPLKPTKKGKEPAEAPQAPPVLRLRRSAPPAVVAAPPPALPSGREMMGLLGNVSPSRAAAYDFNRMWPETRSAAQIAADNEAARVERLARQEAERLVSIFEGYSDRPLEPWDSSLPKPPPPPPKR